MTPEQSNDGINPTIDAEPPVAGGFQPPVPSELAASFPQLEILDLVGHGGMGAVYRARQKSLDRIVALKIIKADMAEVPGFAERFVREAKALARLNHPNIVGVHDFGETDGLFYFVMEFVDGADLRRLIESRELPPAQALQIVPQICEALQYAHDQGIVHRDIKPENILVDSRGRVKIADFGLAKLVSNVPDHNLTATHQVMGTPRYMAPEQMEGAQSVDHRADIYSLGVVLYELLTGELPLGRFAAPSEKAAIDGRLDEIVMRALEKELPRRYQHASELKTELERISEHDAQPQRATAAATPGGGGAARAAAAAGGAAATAAYTAAPGTPQSAMPADDSPSAIPSPSQFGSLKGHITALGIIHIAFSSIFLVVALIVILVVPGAGIVSQDPQAMQVTAIVGTAVAGFLTLLALPGLAVGVGLIKHQPWSRICAIILALLNLMNMPFGTLLSIYTFWVLLHEETSALFAERPISG